MTNGKPGASSGRLPLRTLLSYGSSMVGLLGVTTMVAVHLMYFYNTVVMLPAIVVGVVMALAQVWDAITDPLIGHLSDRTPWKWGRRRPYILLGALPTAVFFFLVFSPPANLLLSTASIRSPAPLAAKLRDVPQDPLSRHLRGQLSNETKLLLDANETKMLLDEYDPAEAPSDALERLLEALRKALSSELNGVLQGESLYDPQRFAHVLLPDETRRLIEQRPQGKGLIRLNRLLLEQAYPDEIAQGEFSGGALSGLLGLTFLSVRGVAVFFGVVFLLFFTFRTVWDTPYCALAPELTQDYDQRTRVSGYQQVFGTVGDVLGTMAPVILVVLFATQRTGWSFVAALIAALALGSALWTYSGTRENPRLAKASQLSLTESLRATLRNRPYRLLVLTCTCAGMSNYTTIAVVQYVIKYWFRAPAQRPYFFGAFFVGVFVAIPIWMRVTTRVGKKAAYITAMAVYSAILWTIMLLPRGALVPFGCLMFVAGAFNIGLWLIAYSIVPDIIEWDQLTVGERREGAYYGIWTLMRKAAIGGAYIIIALVLTLARFDRRVAEQAASALLGIRLLTGPIPSLLLVIGLIIFLKFPITKHVHQDVLRQLAEREE